MRPEEEENGHTTLETKRASSSKMRDDVTQGPPLPAPENGKKNVDQSSQLPSLETEARAALEEANTNESKHHPTRSCLVCPCFPSSSLAPAATLSNLFVNVSEYKKEEDGWKRTKRRLI